MWSTGRWQLFVFVVRAVSLFIFPLSSVLLLCRCYLHTAPIPGYQLTLHSLAPAGRSPAVNAAKEAQQAETMEGFFSL